MEDIILRAENLKKIYKSGGKEFIAASDISFSLKRGHCLGIVGESGCGKSTIAKMITGISPATSGNLYLNGNNITYLKGRNLIELYRDIQMVFQMPMESFDPKRTLGYGISESLVNFGESKAFITERVNKLLVECGLSEKFADRYPNEVSGGQCQRAAIARALAINPSLLICDEPTSALDVTVSRQILKLLMELKFIHDLSMIIICHNLSIVQLCCDEVLVMRDGKIVEYGPSDMVISNPQEEYTKSLVEQSLI